MRNDVIRAVAVLVLLLAGTCIAGAQGSSSGGVAPADQAAIRSAIEQQLDAFRRDDAAGAYRFAGPTVRRVFPTPEVFIDMVRRGYAPVYRPRSVEFSELALRDGDLVQEVELVGPDGRPVLALYTMVRDPDGQWRIAACVLIPSVRVGA